MSVKGSGAGRINGTMKQNKNTQFKYTGFINLNSDLILLYEMNKDGNARNVLNYVLQIRCHIRKDPVSFHFILFFLIKRRLVSRCPHRQVYYVSPIIFFPFFKRTKIHTHCCRGRKELTFTLLRNVTRCFQHSRHLYIDFRVLNCKHTYYYNKKRRNMTIIFSWVFLTESFSMSPFRQRAVWQQWVFMTA